MNTNRSVLTRVEARRLEDFILDLAKKNEITGPSSIAKKFYEHTGTRVTDRNVEGACVAVGVSTRKSGTSPMSIAYERISKLETRLSALCAKLGENI